MDYDVCSNYGNWLYSAGIGNEPRDNRKFNVIKQGLDYDGSVSPVRLPGDEQRGKAPTVVSGNRGDRSALRMLLQNQFCDLLADGRAGSSWLYGRT